MTVCVKMMYNNPKSKLEEYKMNEVWNLSVIYEGFEDPSYEKDLGKLKEKATAYSAYTAALADKEPLAPTQEMHRPVLRSAGSWR